jgi:O-antigen/teichoic acid export membrane protein
MGLTAAPHQLTRTPIAHSRLARNIAVLAGGQVFTWILSLLWTIVVPRTLGPRAVGQYVVAYSATSIVAAIAGLGISTLLVKEIARDRQQGSRMLGTAFGARIAAALPSAGLVAIFIQVAHFDRFQATLIWIGTASMLLGLLLEPIQSAFQGIERMEYIAFGRGLNTALVTALGIALVLAGFGVISLMLLSLIVAALCVLLNLWWIRPYFSLGVRWDPAGVRALAVSSLPYWLIGINFTVYMWIDSILLSVLTSARVVGWYSVPLRLLGALLFVPVILSTAWLPKLASASVGGGERLRAVARPALEIVLILSLPVAAGAALTAGQLVPMLYGPGFVDSVTILVILSIALPAIYLNVMAYQVLVAMNRQITWTKVLAGATAVNIALNLVLIPVFQSRAQNGAIGAALSLLVTEALQAVAAVKCTWGILDIGGLRRIGLAGLATMGMAGLVWVLRPLGLLVEVPVGALAFTGLALVFRLVALQQLKGAVAVGARWRPFGLQARGGVR